MGPDAGMGAWSLGMGGAAGVRLGARSSFPLLRLPAPQKNFMFFSDFLLSPSQQLLARPVFGSGPALQALTV